MSAEIREGKRLGMSVLVGAVLVSASIVASAFYLDGQETRRHAQLMRAQGSLAEAMNPSRLSGGGLLSGGTAREREVIALEKIAKAVSASAMGGSGVGYGGDGSFLAPEASDEEVPCSQ